MFARRFSTGTIAFRYAKEKRQRNPLDQVVTRNFSGISLTEYERDVSQKKEKNKL